MGSFKLSSYYDTEYYTENYIVIMKELLENSVKNTPPIYYY